MLAPKTAEAEPGRRSRWVGIGRQGATPKGWLSNTSAAPELDTEYTLALEYLSDLAKGAGFEVE